MAPISVNRLVEKVLAHAFFFFFVFEIFSPQIGDRTLYIEYIFIAFNPYFWHWAFSLRFNRQALYVMLPAILLVPFYTITAIKLLVVFLGVAFLVYCYERRLFGVIKPYLLISIGVAAVQLCAMVSGNGAFAHAIGPSNLASLLWGNYATDTYTNFYTVFYFPRVSGLSREAGFFASLLVSAYLAMLVNARLGGESLGKRLSAAYLVGYVFSFSKSSFSLILAFIIIKFRRLVDRIPLVFIGGAFLFVLVLFWHYFESLLILANSITYVSRFGGYALLYDLNLNQLLFGVSDLQHVSGPLARFVAYQAAYGTGLGRLGGIGGWCLHNGIIAFLLYMIGLQALGIRGAGFLFVLLMTATVGPDTNQNFVLLSYYAAFMLSRLAPESELPKRSSRLALPRFRFQPPQLPERQSRT